MHITSHLQCFPPVYALETNGLAILRNKFVPPAPGPFCTDARDRAETPEYLVDVVSFLLSRELAHTTHVAWHWLISVLFNEWFRDRQHDAPGVTGLGVGKRHVETVNR